MESETMEEMVMAVAAPKVNIDHVAIFPYMAKGHTIPLLHFVAALAPRGLKITIITTPANTSFIHDYLGLPRSNIYIATLPFPEHPSIPLGCESIDALPYCSIDACKAFMCATIHMEGYFHEFLRDLSNQGDLPLCVVSDLFLWWTRPVCAKFNVPRLVFDGMGVYTKTVIAYILDYHTQRGINNHETDHDPMEFYLPVSGNPNGLSFELSDIPLELKRLFGKAEPFTEWVSEMIDQQTKSWGILMNSVLEIDSQYMSLHESFYKKYAANGIPSFAWLVGPLNLYTPRPTHYSTNKEPNSCIQWLDEKPIGSVLYVSFGSQLELSNEQLDEIAHGLEASRHYFLWVVRSRTWKPPKALCCSEKFKTGMIHQGWVPQNEVLAHKAIGGFLCHCGWNSVLEALSAGVPILGLPVNADQPLNARYLVDVVKVGMRVTRGLGELVQKEVLCQAVRELMSGEKGRELRNKALELSEVAKNAVQEGGSSAATLDRLLQMLRATRHMEKINGCNN